MYTLFFILLMYALFIHCECGIMGIKRNVHNILFFGFGLIASLVFILSLSTFYLVSKNVSVNQ